VDIEIQIANSGSTSAGGFTSYLYVDPPGPPEQDTPDTSLTFIFGLDAGASYVWTYRNYVFDTSGCGHIIYVWVDRDDDVAEDDETNNLSSVGVCVGMTPTPTSTPTPTPSATPSPTGSPTPHTDTCTLPA